MTPRCFFAIEEELSSRQPWMGEAQLGEFCAAHELGDFRMDRVHLVFQFIGLDEITVEVCRQSGSPRTEPRLTS